jgi:hypothetical protein|tara:strand:- start:314 stop:556 length:243 start_codon:yes stop_codon:yes gene_type:complete
VKINIEIQRGTKTLHQSNGARLCLYGFKPCLFDQVRLNGSVNNPQHANHDLQAIGQKESQWVWKAENPLTERLMRQDIVN